MVLLRVSTGLCTQGAALPEESAEQTKRCSTHLQGNLDQRKCGDSGVLLCAHMELSILERVGSKQNAAVSVCRTSLSRERAEIVGCCYMHQCGLRKTLQYAHTGLPVAE